MTIPTPAWLQWGIGGLLLIQFWLMVAVLWKIVKMVFEFFGNHMTKSTAILNRLYERIGDCPHRDEEKENRR